MFFLLQNPFLCKQALKLQPLQNRNLNGYSALCSHWIYGLGINYEIGFISKNMRSVTHCLYGESTHTHWNYFFFWRQFYLTSFNKFSFLQKNFVTYLLTRKVFSIGNINNKYQRGSVFYIRLLRYTMGSKPLWSRNLNYFTVWLYSKLFIFHRNYILKISYLISERLKFNSAFKKEWDLLWYRIIKIF